MRGWSGPGGWGARGAASPKPTAGRNRTGTAAQAGPEHHLRTRKELSGTINKSLRKDWKPGLALGWLCPSTTSSSHSRTCPPSAWGPTSGEVRILCGLLVSNSLPPARTQRVDRDRKQHCDKRHQLASSSPGRGDAPFPNAHAPLSCAQLRERHLPCHCPGAKAQPRPGPCPPGFPAWCCQEGHGQRSATSRKQPLLEEEL